MAKYTPSKLFKDKKGFLIKILIPTYIDWREP